MRSQNKKFSSFVHNYISGSTDSDNKHISNKTDFQRWISRFGLSPRFKPFLSWSKRLEERVLLNWDCLGLSFRGIYIYLVIIIIIIIIILLLLILLLFLLLSLLSQSLLVFFLCISRAQTMHLERQSLKSIILFLH